MTIHMEKGFLILKLHWMQLFFNGRFPISFKAQLYLLKFELHKSFLSISYSEWYMITAVKFIPITFIGSTCAAGLAIMYLFPKNFLLQFFGGHGIPDECLGAFCKRKKKKTVRGEMVSLKKFLDIQSSYHMCQFNSCLCLRIIATYAWDMESVLTDILNHLQDGLV